MPDVLPNFFIVGAAKSGTTSLYNYLRQHPDVYVSPMKEPHWFSRVKPHAKRKAYAVTSEDEYLDLFRDWQGERAIGEASPSYLWDSRAPYRIKERIPNAKIIVLLREPISRAHSHYLMDVRTGGQNKPFYEALVQDYGSQRKGWYISHLYVELGLYCEQVSRYLDEFGPENVLILFFEDFAADTASALRSVTCFLGVDDDMVNHISYQERHNYNVMPRNRFSRLILNSHGARIVGRRFLPESLRILLRDNMLSRGGWKPSIESEAREFLQSIYAPENSRLEKLLGHELPWRFSR